MNRPVALLVGLGALVVAVAYYFLLWAPKSDRLAEIEAAIEQADLQQIQLQQRINTLQDVRSRAPDLEAQIVAAESIVPPEMAVPAALRQLVLAADDSGVDLMQVSPARPAPLAAAEEPGLASMNVTLQVEGGYFQLVDFLRRLEDPTISPRGFVWAAVSLTPADYPTLTANVSGAMFAVLRVAGETAGETPAETEEGAEASGEVTP
ncbi:MAG: hypothetical protein ACRDUY_06660 [Nitriliruptorales bacterium]